MYCPYCGRDIPTRTSICPACRGVVSEAMMAAYYSDPKPAEKASRAPEYTYETVQQQEYEEPKRRKWPLIVALVFLLAIVAFIVTPLIQESMSANRTDHRVTFVMKTPGYNDEATAIPVHVSGTQSNGAAYDKMVFLDGGGNGIVLEPGEYTLDFPGGSILANGTVLTAPKKTTINVSIADDLPRNAFVQVPVDTAVTYKAVSPIKLSDKVLDGVYEYAVQDPNDNGKADKLRENAKKVREEAIAKREKDAAAIEKEATGKLKVSEGDEAKFVGTLEIQTAEEVAAKSGDESIGWNLGGQKLAVLWLEKTRKVTVETAYSDDYDGYEGYYDEEDGQTYTNSQEFQVKCIILNTDVEGVYSAPDDGTLSSHEGKTVLAEGHVYLNTDWASSSVSPITLADPMLEDL